jgi:EAL domain-containing protein (putative c-di-GMP-specific phosphodiesterase class I)
VLEVMRGIVTLANAFGLPTVVEDIETQGQADLLLKVGCTYFQGYLFGRPEPLSPSAEPSDLSPSLSVHGTVQE